MIALRPHQIRALDETADEYRRYRRLILVMATGGGKTLTATQLAQRAERKGTRTLFVAHRRELVEQLSEALSVWNVKHGLIAPWSEECVAPVQVASVATLARRLQKHPDRYRFDLLVLDECHHVVSGSQFGQIVEANPDAWLLGLTATPARLDGRGLGIEAGGYFEAIVQGPQPQDLVDAGYLAPLEIYAPVLASRETLHIRGGDFVPSEIETMMDTPKITGDAIAHYHRLAHAEPAVAFCATRRHAEHTAAAFRGAGYRAETLFGTTPADQRAARIAALNRRELDLLATVNVVSEGTDIPGASVGIMLRPTQSEPLFLQMVGRLLRIHTGKLRALLLDHVGNVLVHGHPLDKRDWSLAGRPKRDGAAASRGIKQCEQCYFVHRPAPSCPRCGFVYPVASRAEIEQIDGELQKLEREQLAKRRRMDVGRAETLEDLQRIAKARGYNPKWAYFRWKIKQKKARA